MKCKPHIVLALDPAKAAGFALFVGGKLVSSGAADGSMWHTLIEAMKVITPFIVTQGNDSICLIEDAVYVGPRNFKGMMTLGLRRGLCQAAAEYFGFRKFEFIGPNTWQHGLGYKRGGESKAFSAEYAAKHFGVQHVTHDESDAICIGHYYLLTAAVKPK